MLIFLGGVERVLWGSRAAIGLHQARHYDCDRFGTSLATHRIKDYLRDVVPATADPISRSSPSRRAYPSGGSSAKARSALASRRSSKRREWTCSAPKQAGAWRN